MRPVLPLVVLLALARLLPAQEVPPVLVVKEGEKSTRLGLARLDIDVRIHGDVAATSTTMTFANPTDRVMEGDLYFPLPEGATVSGYALDIDGKMVDGVAVEKHKGREVFEKIVRQGIDPGLVEWTKGNNFKTRVFPIPAHGSRTIRVSYVSELIGGQGAPAYHLPLNFKDKIDEFSLRVEVVKPVSAPQITQGDLADFAFSQWRDSYVAETALKDIAPARDLVIGLPDVEKQNVLVEKTEGGDVYFAVHDVPELPAINREVPVPRHIVLYWDASGSRGLGDHRRELEVLRAYFDGLRGNRSVGPAVSVDLVLLRNDVSPPRRLVMPGGNPDKLIAALEQVDYDGGTQLGAIVPIGEGAKPDFYMLFTDGISNFGLEEPAELDAPLYIFSADATANHAFLRQLAMKSGGQYFNLKRMPTADVVGAIGTSAYSFLRAHVQGGQAEELYPALPQPVAGRFTLVGKLAGPTATVTLDYGFPGQVGRTKTFTISAGDAAEGTLLARLWAQKKLADLMIFQDRNEEEIVALGKQFGMVTPFTSLIVLDSLEQYLEHEICPPKSLPEMRNEYLRQMDTVERQQKKQQADKLEQVIAMWQARVAWWEKEFKYPKDFKYREKDENRDGQGRGGEDRESGARPAPPASVAPSAPSGEGREVPERAAPEAPAPAEQPEDRLMDMSGAARESQTGALREEMEDTSRADAPAIAIKPWDPKTPYLEALKEASADHALAAYMKQRAQFGTSPAFFLDCADFFAKADDQGLALQVLSNVAELELENPQLLRVLGHRLAQTGRLDLAILTFEEVLALRPEEPQSYRDLALVLARRARENADFMTRARFTPEGLEKHRASIRDDYTRAIDLLWQVVAGRWDDRFAEIEVIALEELNAILPRAGQFGVEKTPVDKRLVKLLDFDVRIVMTWHADNTDIDLWVIEPSGEKAFYGHNRTTIGGMVSRDFTGGYGPEVYTVRNAMRGMYDVKANYYGSSAVKLLGAVTVQLDVFTDFGRSTEQRKSITVRLKEAKDTVTIGQIEF